MTHYTPGWKDNKGNRIIIPARNTLFDDESAAREWQIGESLWMIPFGLMMDGVVALEADSDGVAELPHVRVTHPKLGACAVIAGPDGPSSVSAE